MSARGRWGTGPWERRPALVGVGMVVALVAALTGLMGVGAVGHDPSRCERFAADASARAAVVTGRGEGVVVVGDSWAVGLGLEQAARSWPSRLAGSVQVAGFSGSGFSAHASGCGAVSFADRAGGAVRGTDGGANLIVVQGGLNDYDQSDTEIRAGFRRLMRELRGREVVVVGPASAPARGAAVRHVDALLSAMARQWGVPYVQTSELRLAYLPDRLHLTPAGHEVFGDYVQHQLDSRGLH